MGIELNNVCKGFMRGNSYSINEMIRGRVDKIEVLHDINLKVENGQLYGILGRNGAGKSTLLRVVGGVYSYEGLIVIDGDISSIFELGVVLNKNQTGREYCHDFFYYTMEHYDKRKAQILTEEIKNFTELEDYFERPVRTYSSGMLAKLLFAAATSISADVVLIDEALVVGDAVFQAKARRRLWNMLKNGCTGLVVSHDWTALLRLCTNGVIMDHGKIVQQGDIRDCIKAYVGFAELHANEIFVSNKSELCRTKCRWKEKGKLEFDIEMRVVPNDEMLEVNVMIEKFSLGIGWNIIYTNGTCFKAERTGTYHIVVFFPDLLLSDGEYNLGIHLSDRISENGSNVKTYDRMQWLEHSEIRICVENESPSIGIFKGMIKWKKKILQE